MARQDLDRLQAMCKNADKVIPKEWPEGLIGVGPDMRAWVKAQDDAKGKKSVSNSGKKQQSKSNEKSEE